MPSKNIPSKQNQTADTSAPTKRRAHPWAWIPSLYFAEGMPNAIVVTTSILMYKNLGVSNTETAFFTSLVYLAWVIKPLWSPFVDIFHTKRQWIVATQLMLAIAFGAIALLLNTPIFFVGTIVMFFLMAFVSATHDIAADGFYMLGLTSRQQSYFVGIRNIAYKLATIVAMAGGTALSGVLINVGFSSAMSWTIVMAIIGCLFLAFAAYHRFILPRPADDHSNDNHSAANVWNEFGDTFKTFFQKKGILIALLFMMLYRLPESLLTKMITPFLVDPVDQGGLGLTNEAVGIIYGLVGTIGLLGGGLLGGFLISRGGLKRWIQPMAWSMSLTCLTFLLLSHTHNPSLLIVNACVFIEQFGYGFGFSAYMLYLIYFARGHYATAHYAISTGFMALGLMLPGMAAGWLQELLGYQNFFLATIACCVTTIYVAMIVKIDPQFGKK